MSELSNFNWPKDPLKSIQFGEPHYNILSLSFNRSQLHGIPKIAFLLLLFIQEI